MRIKDLKVGDYFVGTFTANKYVVLENDGKGLYYAWMEGVDTRRASNRYELYDRIEAVACTVFSANTAVRGARVEMTAKPKFKFGDAVKYRRLDEVRDKLLITKVGTQAPYKVWVVNEKDTFRTWVHETELERDYR
jgi:hypothetical protein